MIYRLIVLNILISWVWSQDPDRPLFCPAFVNNEQEVGYYSLSRQDGPQLFIGDYYWNFDISDGPEDIGKLPCAQPCAKLWANLTRLRIDPTIPSDSQAAIDKDKNIHRRNGVLIAILTGSRNYLYVYNKDKVISSCFADGFNLDSGCTTPLAQQTDCSQFDKDPTATTRRPPSSSSSTKPPSTTAKPSYSTRTTPSSTQKITDGRSEVTTSTTSTTTTLTSAEVTTGQTSAVSMSQSTKSNKDIQESATHIVVIIIFMIVLTAVLLFLIGFVLFYSRSIDSSH